MSATTLDLIASNPESLEKLSREEAYALIGEVAILDARLRSRLAEFGTGSRNQPDGGKDRILTVEEAAKRLAVTGQNVYELLRKGDLPGFRVGKYWRIDEGDLRRWIEKQEESEVENGAFRWKRAGKNRAPRDRVKQPGVSG